MRTDLHRTDSAKQFPFSLQKSFEVRLHHCDFCQQQTFHEVVTGFDEENAGAAKNALMLKCKQCEAFTLV